MMAHIAADRLVRDLEQSGFVVMKRGRNPTTRRPIIRPALVDDRGQGGRAGPPDALSSS
jgi:hypothetical protein